MYKHRLLKCIAIVVLTFVFIPLMLIVLTSFNTRNVIGLPTDGISFRWFAKVFKSRSLMSGLKLSLSLGVGAAALGMVVGLFAAIAMNRRPGKLSEFFRNLFMMPSLIPGIVIGYVLFQSIVVQYAIPLSWALVIGHLLIVLPYTVRILLAGLGECDPSIEEAARTLGCPPVKAFVKVVLPDLQPAILSAFMLAFINSFNNIPVSLYLKGPGINTLPYAMMTYIEYNYDPTVSALSVMLMGLTLIFMMLSGLIATSGAKKGGGK